MPVRIYEIAKKLGLENKQVLTKAKELGIAAAKVPSSSLDKITAEYLEQQLFEAHPDLKARLETPPPPPTPPPAPEPPPVVVVSPSPEPPPVAPEVPAPAPPVAAEVAPPEPVPVPVPEIPP
ncbi:MAG: translation initiation factor IF-2 N-terminal domain-containing protein, partial [Limisphaerales bacterium]